MTACLLTAAGWILAGIGALIVLVCLVGMLIGSANATEREWEARRRRRRRQRERPEWLRRIDREHAADLAYYEGLDQGRKA